MVPRAVFGRAKICFLDAALGAGCFQIGCALPALRSTQSLSAVARAASSDPTSLAVEPVKCGVAGGFGWQQQLANAVTKPNGSTSASVAPPLRRAATRIKGDRSECVHLQTIMSSRSGIRVKRLAPVR